MNNDTRLFVHLGLPKTGTTYLQKAIFRHLDCLYLEKAKEVSIWDLIYSDKQNILISSEHLLANPFNSYKEGWSAHFFNNLKRLHDLFPCAEYLITLRKHENLLLSYYKEHISKGGREDYPRIEEFFDIDNNNGHIKWEDLVFSDLIGLIEGVTGKSPLIIMQEDLRSKPTEVLSTLCWFMKINPPNIHLKDSSINTGVYKEQLQLLLKMNKLNQTLNQYGLDLYNPFFVKYGLTPDYIARKRLRWMGKSPVQLPENLRLFINDYYAHDWTNILQKVKCQGKLKVKSAF